MPNAKPAPARRVGASSTARITTLAARPATASICTGSRRARPSVSYARRSTTRGDTWRMDSRGMSEKAAATHNPTASPAATAGHEGEKRTSTGSSPAIVSGNTA